MRLKWVVVGCLSIAVGGMAQARSPSRRQVATDEDQRLQKELLAEILADDSPALARSPSDSAKPIGASAQTGAPEQSRLNAEPPDEVGTSVASVPTWPVMGLVVLLAGVLVWLKRGKWSRDQSGVISKLATVPLGGKRSLALVEVLGQKLVLGLSEKGLSLLARIDGCELQPTEKPISEAAAPEVDPFEEELRDLLVSEHAGATGGPPAPAERLDLARKFRHLRSG